MDKPLIIFGSAKCVFDDLMRLKMLGLNFETEQPDVMAINMGALYYPFPVKYWTSLHPELFTPYRQYMRGSPTTHCNHQAEGVDVVWPMKIEAMDSGLFSARIAKKMGYGRVILCGIPIDGSRKFYEKFGANSIFGSDSAHNEWLRFMPEFSDTTRSMSGNTRKWLGEPTRQWILTQES